MDIETRRRIRAYKKALPELRERVIAVALLLAMSASMLTSASFAWLTISRRPEVTGVSTTVAANGNLEIALATGTTVNPVKPEESQVGDSSAAQDVTKANITWGNLINLSDSSYGLDNLTLRPAQLNRSSLLINPLFGAEYQGDGRVEKLNSNFGFSTWQEKDGNWRFFVSNDIGVRAISSTKYEAVGFAQQVYEKRSDAETANLMAGSSYTVITQNKEWMDSLAAIMGTYMTARMNAGQGDESLTNPTMEQEDVQNLTAIFGAFVDVYDQQFEAMAKLANYQIFLISSSNSSFSLSEKTADDMKATATTEATLKKEGLQINGLNQAKKDYTNLVEGYANLQDLSGQGSVKWEDSGLNEIVNSLMNVGKCTVEGTPINNIGVSNAAEYLDKTNNAVLTNGVLYNFEEMNGSRCDVKGLSISAKVKRMGVTIPATVTANITTNAPVPSLFSVDLEHADSLNTGGGQGEEVAQDTYGLAVDLWVRTNADNSYLTLEGNVLTKSEMVQATGTDRNGETRDIYTLKREEEVEAEDGTTSTESIELDLYMIETTTTDETTGEETTTTTWYNAANHATVTLEEGETPILKKVEVITVIGFEGENRIWEDANAWEDNSQLSLDSTTQGSGSCYVYYADTPEDQARSLELLGAMNVAFVDDEGVLMATAEMDVERYYAENGRVTVPLVLGSDSLEAGTNSAGETIYAITPLEKNVPKRITAIVYLDGTKLTNENVLSASDIQGKLNIQFGSSETLSHAKDETLLNATRSVTASATPNQFAYDESKASGTPMTTHVTVNVDGDAPSTVTAFFIRAISSTQGSREEVMTFTQQADGSWTSDYTFTAPGEYVLRSVELDGQTYDLDNPPAVTVEGFTIKSLSQNEGKHASIMTAASSFSTNLTLQFASNDPKAMPSTVQGRYLRQDGTAVNVNFTYNATNNMWEGKANFISSGDYTLQYLVLDGEYTELDESMWQSATVYLGMKVAVYTDSPTQFKYVPSELADNQKNLYMKVSIMDNTGEEMQGLQDARLYYAKQGSSNLLNGKDAVLTWNAASGYYECTYQAEIGNFYFSQVTVGNNSITYAETSPTFRIQSPEPPSYNAETGVISLPYRYDPDGETTMQVNLSYSTGTTVAAVIRNLGDGKTYEVQGDMTKDENNQQTWDFLIPTTADGKQDGNWQLETVKVWNYYDAAGNYIKAEVDESGKLIADGERDDPLEFSIDGHITKAVTTVYVTATNIADAELGKDGETVTGKFMDSYNISGLTVTMKDFEGDAVEGGSVTLGYTYGNNSSTYGGYSSDSLNNTLANIDAFALTSTDGKTFTQNGSLTVQYAGTYTPVLTCKIGNNICAVSEAEQNKLAFSIHSVAPSVSITGVAPTGTYSVDTNTSGQLGDGDGYKTRTASGWFGSTYTEYSHYWKTATQHLTTAANTSNIPKIANGNKTAYVYFKCTHTDSATYGGTGYYASESLAKWADIDTLKYHEYVQPTVTITLAGKGNAETVTLSFGDSAHVYATQGGTTSAPYSWTADGGKTMYIGLYGDSDSDDDTKTVAGTITATTLELVHNGITYTVDIADITINNPY